LGIRERYTRTKDKSRIDEGEYPDNKRKKKGRLRKTVAVKVKGVE